MLFSDLKISIYCILFFVICCNPLSSPAQEAVNCNFNDRNNLTSNKKALKYYNKALDALSIPDFTQAQEMLKQAFLADTNFVKAYYTLADVMSYQEKLEDAKKYFQKTLSLCPEYVHNIYYRLGKITYALNDYAGSSEYMNEFLSGDNLDIDKEEEAKDLLKLAVFYNGIYSNPVPFAPKPVPGICTSDGEYLPILSPDNDIFLFTRSYHKKVKGPYSDKFVEEFCLSRRTEEQFEPGQPLTSPFNQGKNEGGASLTIDNNEVYLTICHLPEGYGECDIYYSKFQDGAWQPLTNLGQGINTEYWESQVSVSPDSKTLYYASDRPGGLGGTDLYMIHKDSSGHWGMPVNLGPNINTPSNEKSPFIHPDNKTLYFSSDGHLGLGELDIFISRKNNLGNWNKPVNIGFPINSTANDIGFFVSTDGKKGYFASNKLEGNGGWDIYSFDLHLNARPENVLFLKGELKDEKDKVIKDAKFELKNLRTESTTKINVDTTTGRYVHVQTVDSADYMLSVQKEGYFYGSEFFDNEDTLISMPHTVNFTLSEVKKGATFTVENILFTTNSYELTEISRTELNNLVDFLLVNPTVKIAIQGYTDNVGDDNSNLTLSDNRAKAVYEYIISKEIPEKRIAYKGFGEKSPIASNNTEEGRALNRRTEIKILKK